MEGKLRCFWLSCQHNFFLDACISSCLLIGTKREAEDRIVPRSIDADDSDVDVKEADDDDDDNDR